MASTLITPEPMPSNPDSVPSAEHDAESGRHAADKIPFGAAEGMDKFHSSGGVLLKDLGQDFSDSGGCGRPD